MEGGQRSLQGIVGAQENRGRGGGTMDPKVRKKIDQRGKIVDWSCTGSYVNPEKRGGGDERSGDILLGSS